MLCSVNILQFIFIALKLDEIIHWPWLVRTTDPYMCLFHWTRACRLLYLFFTLLQSKTSVFVSAGGLCPTVDPHVLLVPRCPLLHHLVSPLPALHRHHRWATENSHHHGDQLDDHCCPSSHLWGEQFKQNLTLFTVTRRGTIKHRVMKLICFLSLYFISCCRAFVLNSYLWEKKRLINLQAHFRCIAFQVYLSI